MPDHAQTTPVKVSYRPRFVSHVSWREPDVLKCGLHHASQRAIDDRVKNVTKKLQKFQKRHLKSLDRDESIRCIWHQKIKYYFSSEALLSLCCQKDLVL